jgi:hypothetical protein
MPKEDDILTEKINTAFFLFPGILSMIVSMTIIANSATTALYGQQLPMDLIYRVIFAPLFFS